MPPSGIRSGCCWCGSTNTTKRCRNCASASELAPDNTRYAYVYAIALNSTGTPAEARALLERVHQQHPTDRDVLLALVLMARDANDVSTALRHARELLMLAPADPQLRAIIVDLQKRQAR